jgi:hypothetical protein
LTLIELIWTISPAFILIAIAFPSFRLLYLLDEVISPTITIKVVGFLKNGQKSYILNKKKDTSVNNWGQNNIIQSLNRFCNLNLLSKINKKEYPIAKFSYSHSSINKKHFHTRCRGINRIGPHDMAVISVIFGLILGDGYLSNRIGEGVRICIRQSIIHKDYLLWLYEFFYSRGYCSNNEPRQYTRTIKGKDGKIYLGFEFNSYTFRSFVWIYDLFYKKGKKVIPFIISNYITPLTLAIWISDDGTFIPSTGGRGGVRIACNSFTLQEVEYLASILRNKFDLDCTIQKIYIKDRNSIYIKKNSIQKLENLILPYLHVSMHYKLGL